MRTPVFTGNCVAIATPFDASGTINYDAFGRLIDAQIAGGVVLILLCIKVLLEHLGVIAF